MNIKIKSTNVDQSPSVEEYVTKKMSSLGKFFGDSGDVLCEVELAKTTGHHKSGDIFKAEANITCAGKQFYAVAENDDIYASIDELRDESERIIVSNKKKYTKLFRHGASKIKNIIKRFQ